MLGTTPQITREPLTQLRVLHRTFRVRCAPGICARCVPRKGRCHVDRCTVDIGSDLLSRPLPDLAVARSVEGAADHTDSRHHPRSALPVPASLVAAFLGVPLELNRSRLWPPSPIRTRARP